MPTSFAASKMIPEPGGSSVIVFPLGVAFIAVAKLI